jgi:hypothetical protein
MKVAFTICSNNYLAQAKTLGDSLMKFNPEYRFIIGLVDRFSQQINYQSDIKYEVIRIEDIGIQDFNRLWKKYGIIELNTCVKPGMFKYLFKRYPELDCLFYFDPDIMIFSNLSEIESKFLKSDFILSPHILLPLAISDQRPNESDYLNFGIYNIGFLGLKKTDQILLNFLPWWEERTLKLGYIRPCDGLFVDQIWFNLVPLFFSKVHILNHKGCNVAPWNLHERELSWSSNGIIVNNKENLVFFHFSSFKYTEPATLFFNYDRNLIYVNETVETIYKSYYSLIIENGVKLYSGIKCHYIELKERLDTDIKKKQNPVKRKIKQILKNLMPYFLVKKMIKTGYPGR